MRSPRQRLDKAHDACVSRRAEARIVPEPFDRDRRLGEDRAQGGHDGLGAGVEGQAIRAATSVPASERISKSTVADWGTCSPAPALHLAGVHGGIGNVVIAVEGPRRGEPRLQRPDHPDEIRRKVQRVERQRRQRRMPLAALCRWRASATLPLCRWQPASPSVRPRCTSPVSPARSPAGRSGSARPCSPLPHRRRAQVQRHLEVAPRRAQHRRHGGGDKALHVGRAAAVKPPLGLSQADGGPCPGLSFDRATSVCPTASPRPGQTGRRWPRGWLAPRHVGHKLRHDACFGQKARHKVHQRPIGVELTVSKAISRSSICRVSIAALCCRLPC